MKNVKIILLLLFVSSFIGNGCRKDDTHYPQYDDIYFRMDNIGHLTKYKGKVRNRTAQNDELILQTIEKVHDYYTEHDIDTVKQMLESRFGYPLWALTKKVYLPNNLFQTITPVFHPNQQLITNFVYTYSYNDDVSMMSVKNTLRGEFLVLQQAFQNELDGIYNDIYFRGTGEGGIGQNGGNGPTTLDCTEVIELEFIGDWGEVLGGGFINDPRIQYDYITGEILFTVPSSPTEATNYA